MFDSGSIVFSIKAMGAQVFKKDLDEVESAAKKAGTTTTDTAKKTEELGNKQDATGRKSKALGVELGSMSDKAKQASTQIGQTLLGVGASLIAVTALAVKSAIDWESAWAGVTKTIDATPAELNDIEDGLRGLAKILPATHTEIAAVAEAAGQLGVASKDVVSFTKTMVDLGETTNLTSDEAATAIAQLMNIMQTAPEDVDRLGSALVALGNNGASTEKDIIFMAQRIAGAGKIIGLTEAEVLSFANALASAGIDVEAGGSAISRIMTDIAKQVSTNGKDLPKWAAVAGVSAKQFAKSFKEDPAEAINSFIVGLGKMNAAGGDVFTTLEDLGQSDIRVSNALLSMANAGDLLTGSLEIGTKAWDENIALQTEAEKRYETTAAKIQIMQNNVNDAAINLGTVFLPALASATEGVSAMAAMLGSMSPEWQGFIGSAGLGIGAIALFGGAALIAIPKIVEFRAAVALLRTELPLVDKGARGAASALKMLTAVAVVAWLAQTVGGFLDSSREALGLQESVESLTESLEKAGAKKTVDLVAGEGLNTLAALTDGGFWSDLNKGAMNAVGGLSKFMPMFKLLGVESSNVAGKLGTVDKTMAALVASGKTEEAGELYKELASRTDGSKEAIRRLNDLLPEYTKLQGDATEGTGAAATAAETKAAAIEAMVAADELAIQKSEEWRAEIAEADASFIDLGGTYDSVVEKNKAVAQSTADATDSTKDSWETFYDGVTVAIGDYILELQKQVDAQNDWESNMILLSGRVSDAMLTELGKLGPEGAPLVAQLVTASDEELSKMEGLYAEKAGAATGAFATTLANAQAIIAAAGSQLGAAAAAEIAAKLANGTVTVEQIMAEYKLEIESTNPLVTVNTSDSQARLDTLLNSFRKISGATIKPIKQGDGSMLQPVWPEADGGKVNFYANGGRENHIAQFARAGTMRVWAEPETGGEWYIPASPAKRARSTQILQQAANEFGYQLVPAGAQSFADGGRSSDAQIMAGRSSKPVRIEGTLDLGNGLRGLIRGTINDLAKEL